MSMYVKHRRRATSGFMPPIGHGVDMRGPSHHCGAKNIIIRIIYPTPEARQRMALIQEYLRATYPEKFMAYRKRGLRRQPRGAHGEPRRQAPGVSSHEMAKARAWADEQMSARRWTYEQVSTALDSLRQLPTTEAYRAAFRAAWLSVIKRAGWTEEEYDVAMEVQIAKEGVT